MKPVGPYVQPFSLNGCLVRPAEQLPGLGNDTPQPPQQVGRCQSGPAIELMEEPCPRFEEIGWQPALVKCAFLYRRTTASQMDYMSIRIVHYLPPGFPGSIAIFNILEAHEITIIKQAHLLNYLVADKHARETCPLRVGDCFLNGHGNHVGRNYSFKKTCLRGADQLTARGVKTKTTALPFAVRPFQSRAE